MICSVCQNILRVQDVHFMAVADWKSGSHHRTCTSLKHSIENGCYICNQFWAILTPEERYLVLASGDSDSDSSSDDVEFSTEGEPANFVANSITACSLRGGRQYGHQRCYQMKLAFVPSRRLKSGYIMTPWRVTFLLQPHDGTIRTNGDNCHLI